MLPASVCSGADGPSFLERYGAGGVVRDGRELSPARRRLAWRCSLRIDAGADTDTGAGTDAGADTSTDTATVTDPSQ